MKIHPIYGELAYLDSSSPDALHAFCLVGSRAPLIAVEGMLLCGKSPAEICTDPVLGLGGRQALVERIAEICLSIDARRTAA